MYSPVSFCLGEDNWKFCLISTFLLATFGSFNWGSWYSKSSDFCTYPTTSCLTVFWDDFQKSYISAVLQRLKIIKAGNVFLRLVSKLEFQISLNKSYFQKLPFQAFNQKKLDIRLQIKTTQIFGLEGGMLCSYLLRFCM